MASNFTSDYAKEMLNKDIIENSVMLDIFGNGNFQKVEDKELQKRGVDYKALYKGQWIYIDVKEASDYFSHPWDLQTYIFEMFNTSRNKYNITNLGWGIKDLDTTHYLFLKPAERCEDVCRCFEAILVDKKIYTDILSYYLDKFYNIAYNDEDKKQMEEFMEHVRSNKNNKFEELDNRCIKMLAVSYMFFCKVENPFKNKKLDMACFNPETQSKHCNLALFYSGAIHEGPVNLVVPWQLILELANKAGWYHKVIRYTDGIGYSKEDYSDYIMTQLLGKNYINGLHGRTCWTDELWEESVNKILYSK